MYIITKSQLNSYIQRTNIIWRFDRKSVCMDDCKRWCLLKRIILSIHYCFHNHDYYCPGLQVKGTSNSPCECHQMSGDTFAMWLHATETFRATVTLTTCSEWVETCLDVGLRQRDHLGENVSHLQILHLVPLPSSLMKHNKTIPRSDRIY